MKGPPPLLVESVNQKKLEWFRKNIHTIVPEERKKFERYCELFSEPGLLPDTVCTSVSYYQTTPGIGRFYATEALSMQGFSKGIRGELARGIYHDIDMDNCHPVFLLGLCRTNNWEAPELRNYVEHREEVLKLVHPDRSQAKMIMLALMYGSALPPTTKPCPVIDRYKREMKRLSYLVFNRYPIAPKKAKNPQFSRMSLVLQDIENIVLMEMVAFFGRVGYQVGVLVFDGMMIYRKNQEPLSEHLLRECEMHIREATRWEIKLSEKMI
jgi:hypothetical protein